MLDLFGGRLVERGSGTFVKVGVVGDEGVQRTVVRNVEKRKRKRRRKGRRRRRWRRDKGRRGGGERLAVRCEI